MNTTRILEIGAVALIGVSVGCSEQAQTQRTLTDGPQTGQSESYVINANGNNFFLRFPATPTTQPAVEFQQHAANSANQTISGGTVSGSTSPAAGSQTSTPTSTGGAQDSAITPTVDTSIPVNITPGAGTSVGK